MIIIAGLGNPGRKYAKTRHNCGYEALDALADRYKIRVSQEKFRSLCGTGTIDGEDLSWSYDDLATIETSTQTKYKIFSLEADQLTLRLSGSLENWTLKRTAPAERLPLPSN